MLSVLPALWPGWDLTLLGFCSAGCLQEVQGMDGCSWQLGVGAWCCCLGFVPRDAVLAMDKWTEVAGLEGQGKT